MVVLMKPARPTAGFAARIRGRVVGHDGAPLSGARVVVVKAPVPMPEIAAHTDAEGRFVFNVPEPGEYELAAHDDIAPHDPARVVATVPHSVRRVQAREVAEDLDATVSSTDERQAPRGAAAGALEVNAEIVFPSAKK
jgi:hypothetical protein